MASREIKLGAASGADDDEGGEAASAAKEGGASAAAKAAKRKVLLQVERKAMVESIVPIVIELKHYLEVRHSKGARREP